MATSADTSATASLVSAMSRLVHDSDLADLTVTCGEKDWKVHSAILGVRSPFFKAAIINNMKEKLEMKIDIKEFDPEAMDSVINFMYGKPIEKGSIKFLFEASERFQMDDLKEDVIKLARKNITMENVIELGHLGEMYDSDMFLRECADFIVENDVEMKVDDLSPKLTVMVLSIFKDVKRKLNDANEDNKKQLSDASEKLRDCQADAEQKLNRATEVANKKLDNASNKLKDCQAHLLDYYKKEESDRKQRAVPPYNEKDYDFRKRCDICSERFEKHAEKWNGLLQGYKSEEIYRM